MEGEAIFIYMRMAATGVDGTCIGYITTDFLGFSRTFSTSMLWGRQSGCGCTPAREPNEAGEKDHTQLQSLLGIKDTHRPRTVQQGYIWEQMTFPVAVRVLNFE